MNPADPSLAAELATLHEDWTVVHGHLRRRFRTRNFDEALQLAVRIGRLAEEQDHHPILTVAWGRLDLELWTHRIDALGPLDLALARSIDALEV